MPRGRPRKVVPDMREGVPMAQSPDEAKLFDSEEVRTEQEPESENEPEPKQPEPRWVAPPEGSSPDVKVAEPKVEAKPEPPKDEAAEALKRALAAEQKAAEYQRQIQLQAQQYQEAQSLIAQREKDLGQSRYDQVLLAINAAEEAIRGAETQWTQASDDGDKAAQLDAMKRVASAQARLDGLVTEREQFETYRKQQEESAKQPQQQQRRQEHPWGSDAEIDSFNLPAKENAWAKSHRELLTTEANRTKMAALTQYLTAVGIGAGHPDFIPRVEAEFGLSKPEPEAPPPQEQRRTSIVSAPVSRETPGSRQQSGKVELTAAEVEAARISGVSAAEYARQKQRIAQMKANGEYGGDERR